MKKLILIAVITLGALVTFGPLGQAQAAEGGGKGKDRVAQMTKELDLTPAQVEKLKPIMEADRAKYREIRQDTALSQDERRAKMKAIRDASKPKIKEILTPEQFAKWEKSVADRAAKRKKGQ